MIPPQKKELDVPTNQRSGAMMGRRGTCQAPALDRGDPHRTRRDDARADARGEEVDRRDEL